MSSTSDTIRQSHGKILIVGGYGMVGRVIAERLAPPFPDRVVIAGRSLDKARSCAAKIGHGAVGRAVDIFSENVAGALEDVVLAVVCLDQDDIRFVELCLSRGIHYVDVSANYGFLAQVEALDDLARRAGAVAMLSVGVAPGLTNLVAARTGGAMEQVDRLDIFLQLGLGDHHGEAALAWFFENLDAAYEVSEDGRRRPVRSFGESRRIRLPGERIERSAYRFNFSDQHVLARTLNAPAVSTWLCFDNRASTWLFAALSRAGLGRLLRGPRWRAAAIWLFMNVHIGSDVCALAVRATGRIKFGGKMLELGLSGRKEALMTAIVAAETARQVLSVKQRPGVFHSEQAIALDPVVSALKKDLPDLVVTL